MYTAGFDLYCAYTGAHDGVFAGLMNTTVVSRATGVRGDMCSDGYNAGSIYPTTAAQRHVENLPKGSAGSALGGERSDLKIVLQLVSASRCFYSSLLPSGSCKTKV